jgi:1,3-beta-glucanosyltransferase GAS3
MTVLSGGLVYEWTEETSDYGLIQPYSNGTAQLLPDYMTLQNQYNKVNISLLETSNNTATSISAPECNANLLSSGSFSTNFTIPDPPAGAGALISSGVTSAPTGSIVSVTQTSVQVSVYATDGAPIENLRISAASGANHPGASSLSTGAAPSSKASATATSGSSKASGTGSSTGAAASASKSSSAAAFRIDGGSAGSGSGGLAAGLAAAAMGVVAFAL